MAYAIMHPLNMHAQLSNGTSLNLHKRPYMYLPAAKAHLPAAKAQIDYSALQADSPEPSLLALCDTCHNPKTWLR